MAARKIAINRADGGVSIMSFVVTGKGTVLPDGAVWFSHGTWAREPSDENIESEVRRSHPDSVSWRHVADDEIPADRTFRDALVDTGKLEHDIGRAKDLHRRTLRHERASKFAALDVEWMKAIAAGDSAAAQLVEAKRQVLRNLPADPRIDAAVSVEELKSVELPK